MASGPSRAFIVHTSTSQIGGAEASLLAAVSQSPVTPFFLVPSEGPLTRELSSLGIGYRVLAWPRGLSELTQRSWRHWLALPMVLPGLVPYLFRLYAAVREAKGSAEGGDGKGAGTIWSSGLKSHAALVVLSPWLGKSILFDIRDFLKPLAMRRLITGAAMRFGCRVNANSKSVARDYPGAEVHYPMVKLPRAPVDRRSRGGKRIITHLAYFAPYKGQDLFLSCARKLLDAGVDAEFWIIGDVIYPAAAYERYREDIYAQAGRLNLSAHVRFLGKVGGGEEVQALLEQTDLLLHCTREPEPFGRSVMEALLCGCEAICHRDNGVCEVTEAGADFPEWLRQLRSVLGPEYVRLGLKP